jgi:hypothetical protein
MAVRRTSLTQQCLLNKYRRIRGFQRIIALILPVYVFVFVAIKIPSAALLNEYAFTIAMFFFHLHTN